jgi:hypothetical protein
VLATQNPVDLDYKGLSNAGTWFIGRLQTERDKARVVEGLLSSAGDGLDKAKVEALLANLQQRVFLMRNVHEEEPVLLRTRWPCPTARSMTQKEISQLNQSSIVTMANKSASDTTRIKPLYARRYWSVMNSPTPYCPHEIDMMVVILIEC